MDVKDYYTFLKGVKSPLANEFSEYAEKTEKLLTEHILRFGRCSRHIIQVDDVINKIKESEGLYVYSLTHRSCAEGECDDKSCLSIEPKEESITHRISRSNLDSDGYYTISQEDYILKSPMRRIHKIKTKTVVKEVISDESMERMRDACTEKRDLAILDLLYSTGIRVGELVRLNISDVDLEQRECIVFGKGDKERRVYFDAKAKVHLTEYLASRRDGNPALFVTLDAPFTRLKISGVEIRLRQLGRQLSLERIHPHKFRRTMATRAIDKGMPIEALHCGAFRPCHMRRGAPLDL